MKKLKELIQSQIDVNSIEADQASEIGNYNKAAELHFKNSALIGVKIMILQLEKEALDA